MDELFHYDDDEGNAWEAAELLAEDAFDLYEKGQMQQAYEKLKQAMEKTPENGAWYFNMALTLDGMEHYEQAITCYEKALELKPDDPEILNCLGVDYTRTAQYDLALATFEQVQQIDPMFEPAYCNRIITYTEMEQHEQAEQMFYLAQQIHCDCPLCFYNIGNSLFSRGLYDRAIWCWEKTVSLDPGHPQINFRLAQAYWVSGRGRQARQTFLAEIRKNPADLDVLLEFGVFLLEDGDIDAAKEKFNRILEFDAEFSTAHFYLGEVYRLRCELDAAVQQYRTALDNDRRLAGPRFRLAQIFLKQGQAEQAGKLLREELKLEVQDIDVLIQMGGMFLQMGDLENGVNCYLQILDIESEDYRAFCGLGIAMGMRGEYAASRQCLEQSLRLNDENSAALLNAAWVCCRLEDWDAAQVYAARTRALCGEQEPYRSACKTVEKQINAKSSLKRWPTFLQSVLNCAQRNV